ncbi:hypothetical protein I8748_07700 [Nostoc sp. CENA67]|uniref:Uncharacterized protein n=1 Tax=Amazonocrinis nigriterrae CENA67 TaxID=2794033 RepID=A0A8J7HM97_9NOST|nr:hypothetical protein [Amazonocrinis nigriterrae]MBH8562057.1 hypothetical protein [Amazonocrinis nigriterrae CENA67]
MTCKCLLYSSTNCHEKNFAGHARNTIGYGFWRFLTNKIAKNAMIKALLNLVKKLHDYA